MDDVPILRRRRSRLTAAILGLATTPRPPPPSTRRPWSRRSTSRPNSATTRGSLTSSRTSTSRTGRSATRPRPGRSASCWSARLQPVGDGAERDFAGAEVGLFESAERGVTPDQDFAELLRVFDWLGPIVAAVHGTDPGDALLQCVTLHRAREEATMTTKLAPSSG